MIFYFSGTGNTKWAVKKLAKATGEQFMFIPDITSDIYMPSLSDSERIGFCFPVHGWRPPTMVREFIKKLSIEDASRRYVYALVTAGDTIGETIDILRNDLAQKGFPLHAACSLVMPESYVGLPFMDVDTKEKELAKIKDSEKILALFTDIVMAREKKDVHLVRGKWPKTNSRLIGSIFYRHLITDKPFRVETDKCLSCGICAAACCVDNIAWKKGYTPKWKHNGKCMTCFSCYHHCPTHAIEYGNRTKKKGQYYFKFPVDKRTG